MNGERVNFAEYGDISEKIDCSSGNDGLRRNMPLLGSGRHSQLMYRRKPLGHSRIRGKRGYPANYGGVGGLIILACGETGGARAAHTGINGTWQMC